MIDADPYFAAFCAVAWLIVNWSVGAWIGAENGRTLPATLLSILGGPVGWIAALLLTPAPQIVVRRERAIEQQRMKVRDSGGQESPQVQKAKDPTPGAVPIRSTPSAARKPIRPIAPHESASKDGSQKSFEEWIKAEERRWDGE